MLLPLLSVLTVAVALPPTTVDPKQLIDIFGTPPPPVSQKTIVRPTQNGETFADAEEEPCQCMPYYLCDKNLDAVYLTDPKNNGYGILDIRYGNRECERNEELCCKLPKRKPCGTRNRLGLDPDLPKGNVNESLFGEFPWVVALLNADNFTYIGVGVLIHPQVVMTGAHVVYKYAPGKVVARAGEWDTQTQKERLLFQERVAGDFAIHKDYRDDKTVRNDMALLRLNEPFQLAAHINTLCLPEPNEDFDSYKNCVANGWGKTSFGENGKKAVILKKIEVNMVPFERCNELLKRTRLGRRFILDRSFVCAGGEEGKDTCQGDGGAPLACPIGNDRYKLAGLVAWGIECGQKDIPAVYVRVSMFRTWVDNVMNGWGYPTSEYAING